MSPESQWWWLARLLDWPLPEWSIMQGATSVMTKASLGPPTEVWGIVHGLDYILLMLLLAVALFQHRELS